MNGATATSEDSTTDRPLPPRLALNTTIIPRETFQPRTGPTLFHIQPPINGALPAHTRLSRLGRLLIEAAARGEYPGRIFVLVGRGASLGGGRDQEGRYSHDVGIPDATFYASSADGLHSVSVEDAFVRLWTQTAPAPFNDPLLESGFNGIESLPPTAEELEQLLPPPNASAGPVDIECNIPMVAYTRAVPTHPLTPTYGATSLPPYLVPPPWLQPNNDGVAVSASTAGNPADSERVSSPNSNPTVDPASTLGPTINGLSAADIFQPAVLAAFAGTADILQSPIREQSPVLPYVPPEIALDTVHPSHLEPVARSGARSTSPVEHRALNPMAIDSPPWVPSSPTNSDIQRLYQGTDEGDSPPWDHLLHYPPRSSSEIAERGSNESPGDEGNATVAARTVSTTNAAVEDHSYFTIPLSRREATTPDANHEQRELTTEQKLVLLLRAMPAQQPTADFLLRSGPGAGTSSSSVSSTATAADFFSPLKIDELIAAATAATAAAFPPGGSESATQRHGQLTARTSSTTEGRDDAPPRADTPHPSSGIYHRPSKRTRDDSSTTVWGEGAQRFRGEERAAPGEQAAPPIANPSTSQSQDASASETRREEAATSTNGNEGLRVASERNRVRNWTPPGPSPLRWSASPEEAAASVEQEAASTLAPIPEDVEMEELSAREASPPLFSALDEEALQQEEATPHPFAAVLGFPSALDPEPSTTGARRDKGKGVDRGEGNEQQGPSLPPWRIYNEDTGGVVNTAPLPTEAAPSSDVDKDDLTDRDADGETDEEGFVTPPSRPASRSDMNVDSASDEDEPESNTQEINEAAFRLHKLAQKLHANASRTYDAAVAVSKAASQQTDQARLAHMVDEMRAAVQDLLEEEPGCSGTPHRILLRPPMNEPRDKAMNTQDDIRGEAGDATAVSRPPSPALSATSTRSMPELRATRRGSPDISSAGSDTTSSSSLDTPPTSPEQETQEVVDFPTLNPPNPAGIDDTPVYLHLPYERVGGEASGDHQQDGPEPEVPPPVYAEGHPIGSTPEALHRVQPPPFIVHPEPEAITLARIFQKALSEAIAAQHDLHEGDTDTEEVSRILADITRLLQEEAGPVLQAGQRRIGYEPTDLDPALLTQQLRHHLAAVETQANMLEDFVVRRLSRILEDPGFDVVLEAASLQTLFRCVGLDASSDQLLAWWGSIFPNNVYRAPANLRAVTRGGTLHIHPHPNYTRPSTPYGLGAPNHPGHRGHTGDWSFFVRHGWTIIDAVRGFFLSVLETAQLLVSARDWKEEVKANMVNRTVLPPIASPFLYVEEAQYLEAVARVLGYHDDDRTASLIQCAARRTLPHMDNYLRGLMRCGYLGGPVEEICRIVSLRQEELEDGWKAWRRRAWIRRWGPMCADSDQLRREMEEAEGYIGVRAEPGLPDLDDLNEFGEAPLE
ncbi:hypothetical protein K523DRAFT_357815 [Schizophyllum commune Tattone D]|nr:hypothetical protein K523DRAFT_357815 [Schizophyllum commune Tattone D]